MDLFSVLGLAIVAAALCILLKQYKPEYAMLVSIACGALIFFLILKSLSPALSSISGFLKDASINTVYIKAVIKTLGVCYVTQLASDACRDADQTAIASKVELAGKVFIVLISLPLFQDLIDIAVKLMNAGR